MFYLRSQIGVYVIVFLTIMTSCTKVSKPDLIFSQSEYAHFTNYSQNDTICFSDFWGNSEKITIHSMAGRWKQSGVLIKDRYLEMRIEIKNDSTVQNLFTISKKTKSENPKITINFKDFKNTSSEIGFSKLNNDTIVLNGIKIFDYYRIENESASINEVKTIIWTDSKGLTAYQLKNRGWMTINYSKSIDKEALSV